MSLMIIESLSVVVVESSSSSSRLRLIINSTPQQRKGKDGLISGGQIRQKRSPVNIQ
jgi:hypothetical protein